MNIYKNFLISYKRNKHKTFVNFEENKYSYDFVFQKILFLERGFFKSKNLKSVGILSHNKIDHIIIYLFCSKHNLMFIPFDPDVATDDLAKQIKISDCKDLICSNENKKKLLRYDKLKINFYNFFEKKLLNENQTIKLKTTKNNFFVLCFTSGSTGNPKPIAISQNTKYLRAQSNINLYKLHNSERSLITTPFHHTLALRILTMSILLGSEIFVIENYYTNKLLSVIQKKKINFTLFVSNQINSILLNSKNLKKLKSLKALISSSSNLSLENKKKIIKDFDGKIFECYGLSEAAIVSNLDLKKNRKYLDSVGKSIDGVNIKISEKDKNGVGEILVKSKYIFSEYFKKKVFTKSQFNKKFFKTGDLGYLKNNFLYLVGRKKNMIKIKGISVYGEDIEKKIKKLKLIKDCLILGFKDKRDEESICLIYSAKKNTNIDNKIKQYSLHNLSSFQIPRHFIRVKDIPKNRMGKLDKLKIDKILRMYIDSIGNS